LNTNEKIEFRFDDKTTSYLYMNGIIETEKVGKTDYYIRFASPLCSKTIVLLFFKGIIQLYGAIDWAL
jgi:hypothetical protein